MMMMMGRQIGSAEHCFWLNPVLVQCNFGSIHFSLNPLRIRIRIGHEYKDKYEYKSDLPGGSTVAHPFERGAREPRSVAEQPTGDPFGRSAWFSLMLARQGKASKAKQSKVKQRKAKRNQAKQSKAKSMKQRQDYGDDDAFPSTRAVGVVTMSVCFQILVVMSLSTGCHGQAFRGVYVYDYFL